VPALLTGALLLGGALQAGAARIDRLEVHRSGETYRVTLEVRLAAPPERVWAVLTDFHGLARLSPAFREVEVLEAPAAGLQRVRTLARLCVLVFCRDAEQVQDFRRPGPGVLSALVDPALSDLREGEAHWRLEPDGAGTHMHFRARLIPDFWVPPLVGPWAIRRTLLREAETVTDSLERLARTPP
jgi:hypothetical protein